MQGRQNTCSNDHVASPTGAVDPLVGRARTSRSPARRPPPPRASRPNRWRRTPRTRERPRRAAAVGAADQVDHARARPAATILSHAPCRGRRRRRPARQVTPRAPSRAASSADAIRRPPLRVAVGGAGREADERSPTRSTPAAPGASCGPGVAGVGSDAARCAADASASRLTAESQAAHELEVVRRPGARAPRGARTPRVSSQPRPSAR